jgi:integrase
MSRQRKKDRHLPPRMYLRYGTYYFDDPATGKWLNLGQDQGIAFAAYNRLMGPPRAMSVLRDVFARYQREVTPMPLRGRPRTKEGLENEIRTLERFDRLFGHMAQDELKQRHLYEYIDKRLDERKEYKGQKKPAPSAARHDIRFLRKVLAKGIRWGAGETNAAFNLDMDPDPKNTRDVLPAEYAAVYALANVKVQIAMDLASNIGQRRADILGIRLTDLTDEGILVAQGKTDARVLIAWSPALHATIERALALPPDIPKEYVLRRRDGHPYTPHGFGDMWQKLMRKAIRKGVIAARFKFHDLRALAATEKALAETDEAAQQLLGHADVRTTRENYIRRKKPKRATPVR